MITVESISELKVKIAQYKEKGYLFRGQTKNYYTDEFPYSFVTSFDRTT
jgi:hypothetical protein